MKWSLKNSYKWSNNLISRSNDWKKNSFQSKDDLTENHKRELLKWQLMTKYFHFFEFLKSIESNVKMKEVMRRQRKLDLNMRNCFEKKLLAKRTTFEQHRNKNFKVFRMLRRSSLMSSAKLGITTIMNMKQQHIYLLKNLRKSTCLNLKNSKRKCEMISKRNSSSQKTW